MSQVGDERRYDSATLRKVVNLATRLQNRHEEMLTEAQIEAIGAEIGLEPAFVRQALAQLSAPQSRRASERVKRSRFLSLVAAFTLPVAWGMLALGMKDIPGGLAFVAVIAAIPLCGFLGFLVGKKEISGLPAMELVLAVSPALWPHSILYLLAGLPAANALGKLGAKLREEHFEENVGQESVSRQDLLRQLFTVQERLMSERVRKVFLSVDVVGSSEMMLRGPELEAEYSFNQFREWVQRIVLENNGTVQSAAGDGVMAVFDNDVDAVRAAKEIQTKLTLFNAAHNRLSAPFRVRCGISAGEVPADETIGVGDVQSSAVYKAAMLQKRAEPGDIVVGPEVAPAAMLELVHIAPMSGCGEEAYSWRAGQREYGMSA